MPKCIISIIEEDHEALVGVEVLDDVPQYEHDALQCPVQCQNQFQDPGDDTETHTVTP